MRQPFPGSSPSSMVGVRVGVSIVVEWAATHGQVGSRISCLVVALRLRHRRGMRPNPDARPHLRRWNIGVAVICCVAGMHCAAPLPKRARPDIPLTDAGLAELWVEPREADQRDLYHGIGGPNLAPAANVPYDFVSEKKVFRSFS